MNDQFELEEAEALARKDKGPANIGKGRLDQQHFGGRREVKVGGTTT